MKLKLRGDLDVTKVEKLVDKTKPAPR